jgi:hypothetical protein
MKETTFDPLSIQYVNTERGALNQLLQAGAL